MDSIDARLADERHGFAQRLEHRGDQEIAAQFDQIRDFRLIAKEKSLLPQRLKER